MVGYMRPVQDDPDCEVQMNILLKEGCKKIYREKHSSDKNRNELNQLLTTLQKGDTFAVTRLLILVDSISHLAETLKVVEQKGAYVKSIHEAIDTSKQVSYSFSESVHHLATFQSDLISEKTRKGLHKAKKNGVVPGRPRKPDKNVRRAIEMYHSGKYSLADIRNETGISKTTLYRYLGK